MTFYDENANEYALNTGHLNDNLKPIYIKFIGETFGNTIIDVGCGAGRDSKVFKDFNFNVISFDLSKKLAVEAKKINDVDVIHADMNSFNYEKYKPNSIWASASFLHLEDELFNTTLIKGYDALQNDGVFYLSLKEGLGSDTIDGRFFNFFTEEKLKNIFAFLNIRNYEIDKSIELRDGVEIVWLNIFIYKKNEVQNKFISNHNITLCEVLIDYINSAEEIYFNVSFIRDSGIKLIIKALQNAYERGVKITIITTFYMNITEPTALLRLLDIATIKCASTTSSYHPKTFLFKGKDGNLVGIIGSSNISYSALKKGVEWNYIINDQKQLFKIFTEYNLIFVYQSDTITHATLKEYEAKYIPANFNDFPIKSSSLEPRGFQLFALENLKKTREEGHNKGLVIAATGLGKTYLSVFDSIYFKRILFIAHRDEILKKTKESYEAFYKDTRTYGFFNGNKKTTTADITFASVQTLNKTKSLELFSTKHFDYIVMDEFHHAEAKSYKKILDYFSPEFLLGITATPDRMDNGDIYKLCDFNIVYECGLISAINKKWLSPFIYYGVYDDLDYSTIERKGQIYDKQNLLQYYNTKERMDFIYGKYIAINNGLTIAFCSNVEHANYVNEYFTNKNIKSKVILGTTKLEDRDIIFNDARKDDVDIICAVDILNEGIDIPNIDTILFLRPTESITIFIQQLGRGLRKTEVVKKLKVIDFVGNYHDNSKVFNFFNTKYTTDIETRMQKCHEIDMPDGCQLQLDTRVIELLEEERTKLKPNKNQFAFLILKDFNVFTELYNRYPSYEEFLAHSNNLEIYCIKNRLPFSYIDFMKNNASLHLSELEEMFIKNLEKTLLNKNYKIPLLLSFFNNGPKISVSETEIKENALIFYSKNYNCNVIDDPYLFEKIKTSKFNLPCFIQPIKALDKSDFFTKTNNGLEISKKYQDIIDSKPFVIDLIIDIIRTRNLIFIKTKTTF